MVPGDGTSVGRARGHRDLAGALAAAGIPVRLVLPTTRRASVGDPARPPARGRADPARDGSSADIAGRERLVDHGACFVGQNDDMENVRAHFETTGPESGRLHGASTRWSRTAPAARSRTARTFSRQPPTRRGSRARAIAGAVRGTGGPHRDPRLTAASWRDDRRSCIDDVSPSPTTTRVPRAPARAIIVPARRISSGAAAHACGRWPKLRTGATVCDLPTAAALPERVGADTSPAVWGVGGVRLSRCDGDALSTVVRRRVRRGSGRFDLGSEVVSRRTI